MIDLLEFNVAATLRTLKDNEEGNAGDFASALLAANVQLGNYLDCDLVVDPARNILLSMFISEEAGKTMLAKEAQTASCSPPSTALRYIDFLQKRGLISAGLEASDDRERVITLTDDGYQKLLSYLQSISPVALSARRMRM